MDEFRQAFRDAALEDRVHLQVELETLFTALPGMPARRSAGQMYADRTLLYEECKGNWKSFALAAPWSIRFSRSSALP